MRRYAIEVNGKTYTLDVDEIASDRFLVTTGDQTYEVRLAGDEDLPGAEISPLVEPRSPEHHGPTALRDRGTASPGRPRAGNGQQALPPAALPHRQDAATRADGASPGAGALVLRAPMPGVIMEVMAAPGGRVSRSEPVLVLEAMKMRNTICAPRDGVIADVLVKPGQTVRHGDPLVRFAEPAA